MSLRTHFWKDGHSKGEGLTPAGALPQDMLGDNGATVESWKLSDLR